MTSATKWWVYLVRRKDGALYTGIAIDVEQRFAAHLAGRGAKALRGRAPLELVLRREVGTRGAALRVERHIKRLEKQDKERLVRRPRDLGRIIAAIAGADEGMKAPGC